jgi:hypothetical protein
MGQQEFPVLGRGSQTIAGALPTARVALEAQLALGWGMVAQVKRPTEAWCSAVLFKNGFGQVVVARFKLSGDAEVGVFLVDLYCLGIKDAYFINVSALDYESRILGRVTESGEGKESLSPACARKLVEGAVQYAERLGLAPHPDYKKACRVFGGIRPEECERAFTYGKDGKPLFVGTPNDSPEFVHHVMTTLTRRLGTDGFHYILEAGSFDQEPE